jgi:hypothetical protein
MKFAHGVRFANGAEATLHGPARKGTRGWQEPGATGYLEPIVSDHQYACEQPHRGRARMALRVDPVQVAPQVVLRVEGFGSVCKIQNRLSHYAEGPSMCPLASRDPHAHRTGQRLCLHLRPLHPGSGEGGRPQLSPGCELAHAGAHPGAARWTMESSECQESSGALLASDRQAPPHPLQEVSDASAPL